MPHGSLKLLISTDEIAKRVDELAVKISTDIAGASTILVGLLSGSVVFLSDLMRALYHHGLCLKVDFMTVSSYGGALDSSGRIDIVQDVRLDLAGVTVLLVDDIVDTGRTLLEARRHILEKGADRALTCVLLDKPARRVADIRPDYAGFTIEDRFVVGYGLDAAGEHRCLPYIAVLEE